MRAPWAVGREWGRDEQCVNVHVVLDIIIIRACVYVCSSYEYSTYARTYTRTRIYMFTCMRIVIPILIKCQVSGPGH